MRPAPYARPVPVARPACGPGWRWSVYYNRCVRRAATCPRGMRFDGYQCVPWQVCPPNHYWSAAFRQCRPAVRSCPYGYSFRAGYGCMPICPAGWYYENGSCQKVAQTCPDSMFYSYGLRRCVRKCGVGMYWDYRARVCRRSTW